MTTTTTENLTFANFPVEYVGEHRSPRYVRVRYTGEPSLTYGTRNDDRAGQVISVRRDALRGGPKTILTPG